MFLELNSGGEFRHFHVVVVQRRAKKCTKKSVMHVQSCCSANQTYCFFAVLVAVAVDVSCLSSL